MELYQLVTPKPMHKGYYAEAAQKLLDGLVVYRAELGETGRQLEILLRVYGVSASSDLSYTKQVHWATFSVFVVKT